MPNPSGYSGSSKSGVWTDIDSNHRCNLLIIPNHSLRFNIATVNTAVMLCFVQIFHLFPIQAIQKISDTISCHPIFFQKLLFKLEHMTCFCI